MMTGIATTETVPDHILCKACKQHVHLDDIGDHECAPPPALVRADTGFKVQELLPPASVVFPAAPVTLAPPKLARHASMPAGPSPLPPASPAKRLPTPRASSPTKAGTLEWAAMLQARIVRVKVAPEGVAKYAIVTSLWANGPEFTVERRYREFYALAQTLYLMHPSADIWHRLPPKRYCQQAQSLTDGFLLRRKVGLEGFLCAAIDMLLNPHSAGPTTKRTVTQLHVLNEFLGIPVVKDVAGAMKDLRQLATSTDGWNQVTSLAPHDVLFERNADGFLMLKRTAALPYPARAVFDLLTAGPNTAVAKALNPFLVGGQVLRKESNHLWSEHTIYRTFWGFPCVEFFNAKTWRVDPGGVITVISIPAPLTDYPEGWEQSSFRRVDCVLHGWVVTPDPSNPNACSVAMVLHMDYRRFCGSYQRPTRSLLLRHAAELSALRAHLDRSFDRAYYDSMGPLVGLKDLELHSQDTESSVDKDPKVYVVCQQIEPMFCFVVHKNTNRNVLIFKLNVDHRVHDSLQLHPKEPLVAEWVMFEKKNNPRKDLSTIERNTTYEFSTRFIGQGVFLVSFAMLRGALRAAKLPRSSFVGREFQLKVGKDAGYNLFGTIKNSPNVLIKRLFLTFAPSLVGLGHLESVLIVGDSQSELVLAK
ncbi:hypothetical protein ACHHYP_08185 [Achlya hypogyna]|uniref:PX domain-containing protein n=1 Tax=Achlya hypogyna TaxID=1202772 RepID=A0A1V9YPR5_ACHHY|nr:hypothetical protein ACHHYP_08185 [Achlya hypogyna]